MAALLLLFLAALTSAAPSLIPVIDLGSEYMKVAVINPAGKGYPLFDIALNEQSERKTPVVVGFERDGELRTGDDAASLRIRAPERCVYGFMELLGEQLDSEAVSRFLARNPQFKVKLVATPRNTVAFEGLLEGEPLELEILISLFLRSVINRFSVGDMLLSHETVREVVLVVPQHLSAAQTGLLVECATLAGLRVRSVVGELVGAAIEYAVGGQNSGAGNKQNVVVYGMGGAFASATLFEIERNRDKTKKQATVTSLATTPSSPVGGLVFDAAIQRHLIQAFRHAHPQVEPIELNPKALAKLARAAKNAKEELSVSSSSTVRIEKLHAQKDLVVTVTAAEFDVITTTARAQGFQPITQLLRETKSDITVVELFGGGLRVPAVAKELSAAHKGLNLGRHINGDEAAVFGAAYLVASELSLSVPTALVYTPGPVEQAQRHKNLETPLGNLIEQYKKRIAQLDELEAQRQAAQAHEDL